MIAAYVPDLTDRSKVAAAAPGCVFVASPGLLVEAARGARLVVVDLSRPGVLDILPAVAALGTDVIGFASHVNTGLLNEARAAGCTTPMARSAFFARLPALLTSAAG